MILYQLFTAYLEAVVVGMAITLPITTAASVPARSLSFATADPLSTALGRGNERRPSRGARIGRLGVTTLLPTSLAPPGLGQPLRSKERRLALRERKIGTAVRAYDHFI